MKKVINALQIQLISPNDTISGNDPRMMVRAARWLVLLSEIGVVTTIVYSYFKILMNS